MTNGDMHVLTKVPTEAYPVVQAYLETDLLTPLSANTDVLQQGLPCKYVMRLKT